MLSAYFAESTILTVTFVTMAIAGSLTGMALFWTFPGAAGIAAISSVGNLGGFLGLRCSAG